jgi:thiol-disulfide isomerase/thioredoxin
MVELASASASASSTLSSISASLSTNYKYIAIAIVVLAAISGIIYYVISTNMLPGVNKFFQQAQGKSVTADGQDAGGPGDKSAQLYLFKVDWCPHCKTAKPVFDEVEKELNSRPINGYVVTFKTVDCEAEPDMADKFKVEGYPTIKLVKNGEVIEYDAKPEKDKILEFLKTVLQS